MQLALLAAVAAQPVFATDCSGDVIAQFDGVHRADHIEVTADPEDPSNSVLRIDVPAGQFYGASLTVRLSRHMDAEPDRLYFRYRLWIDTSWKTTHGGKLPGFGGTYGRAGWGGRPSNGTNGWSARGLFAGLDEQGRVPIGSYIYHADMAAQEQTYGTGRRWGMALKRGQWYVIEQELELDSVGDDGGEGDGRLRAWVDGELVKTLDDLHLRDSDELRIETVWFNIYHGGKSPSPNDTHVLIDDIWIGAQRPTRAEPARMDQERTTTLPRNQSAPAPSR